MSLPSEPSQRRFCDVLGVNRSSLWRARKAMENQDKEDVPKVVVLENVRRKKLVAAVKAVIDTQPTWGYRRVRAWLVRREGWKVSNKTIQKVFQEHGWQVKKSNKTPRPRVKSSSSVATQPNQRWAVDATSCWSKRYALGSSRPNSWLATVAR